jgi:hypothetical protein
MHRHFDFGVAFEARIAADLAEFMTRIDVAENETWHAELNGSIVGGISIDDQDLDAARKLYQSHGFELAEEYYGDQWGKRILEQKFVRQYPR